MIVTIVEVIAILAIGTTIRVIASNEKVTRKKNSIRDPSTNGTENPPRKRRKRKVSGRITGRTKKKEEKRRKRRNTWNLKNLRHYRKRRNYRTMISRHPPLNHLQPPLR